MKKKSNIICPLCGSDCLIVQDRMKVEDPVNKIFVIKKKVKTCSECGMTTYCHATRGWEGCVFNSISGSVEYYMNNKEFIDGMRDNLKLRKHLPKIIKNKTKQFVSTAIELPASTKTPVDSRFKKGISTVKKEDIYYYKSSLKGIEVLS